MRPLTAVNPDPLHLDLPPSKQKPGISVVIPSRNGKQLLARLLPAIDGAAEIIVVDNGSDDGTADWLAAEWPEVSVALSRAPLSFAAAVNIGIGRALYSHVCLLNNDMVPEPGFLSELRQAFDEVPNLFCSTAQIFFPEGKRREETGKTAFRHLVSDRKTTEFPVHCIEPLPGEDLTWVPYGSGGCSLYDWAKLKALGGIDEIYQPAYVEDLDIGIRAWRQGWPTVLCSNAKTLHDHRTTTSRYYTEDQLEHVLERNYLLFLARNITDGKTFRKLWSDALVRLNLKAALEHNQIAADVLSEAATIIRNSQPVTSLESEAEILALGSGDVAVFPGRGSRLGRTVVVASCYSPYPLSHGGAVRMYNLMRRAATNYSQVLITFVDDLHVPPPELLHICTEVIQVRRRGSHLRQRDTGRPDVVGDFDSPAFRAALKQTISRWAPQIVQLEFTQMAQYADTCGPQAKTILVEHDVTIDLYRQLLSLDENYDTREELKRWTAFEHEAWKQVDCVVTMSEKDRRSIEGARRVHTLPNGVDLNHFQPALPGQSKPGRLLFIGSFNHLPNLLALDFFLEAVWPHLADERASLHVIAGSRHEFFFNRWRDRVSFGLNTPGVQMEDFVADVRPAYQRASIVIAPLLASAGTNIKIMEAMAMAKAIVSTPGGVNGLDELTNGHDILVESDPKRFAEAIRALFHAPRTNCGTRPQRTEDRRTRLQLGRHWQWAEEPVRHPDGKR